MRYLQFAIVFLSLWRLGELMNIPDLDEFLRKNNIPTNEDSIEIEKLYSYGQIISPVEIKSMDIIIQNKPIFEGTVALKYRFNISELLRTNGVVKAEFPQHEVCERSPTFTEFCLGVREKMDLMQKELKIAVTNLMGVNNQTNVAAPLVQQLKYLSNKVNGNGTSDFLQVLKKKEEPLIQNATETIKMCNEQVTNSNEISKTEMIDLDNKLLGSFRNQQVTRVSLIRDLMTKCQYNKLPSMIVSSEALESDLKMLQKKLNESRFEIAIPAEKISVLSIVDCVVSTDKQLQVIVHVPVRQIGKYVIQIVKPYKFKFNQEECSIFPFKNTVVASVGNQLLTISMMEYQKKVGAVYIVRENKEQNYACLEELMKNAFTAKVKTVCPFSCSKANGNVFTETLEYGKYLVSGAKDLRIRCENKVKKYAFPEFGSLVIDNNVCDCETTIFKHDDGNIKYKSSPYFCTTLGKQFPETVHVIPSQWAHLSQNLSDNQQRFGSLDNVYNADWQKDEPVYEMVSDDDDEEEEWTMPELEKLFEPKKTEGLQKKMDKVSPAKIIPWYIWTIAGIMVLFLLSVLCVILWRKVSAARKQNNECNANIELYVI